MFGLRCVAAIATFVSIPAWAHEGDHRVQLHVGDDHESCYFDLHPELTEAEFREFAGEVGQILRSRQLAGADTLGGGRFEVGIGFSYYFLDDTKGAWNNTMSHPTDEHYLGEQLGFPLLALRVGLSKNVDAEAYGSLNWMSNYGFGGVAAKIRVLRQSDRMPISLSVRPSLSGLVGPSEVQALNLSTDVAVSRTFHGFTPFVGATLSGTVVHESSPDTDVEAQAASRLLAFAGLEYRWRFLSAAAQAEISDLAGLSLRVGGSF